MKINKKYSKVCEINDQDCLGKIDGQTTSCIRDWLCTANSSSSKSMFGCGFNLAS